MNDTLLNYDSERTTVKKKMPGKRANVRRAKRAMSMTKLSDNSILFKRPSEDIFFLHPLNGKTPCLRGYNHLADNSSDRIERDFAQFPDATNVGGVIREGFCVLDVDTRHQGQSHLDHLEATHGKLPRTVTVITASEGQHFYFRLPAGFMPSKTKRSIEGYGVELLFAGHNVVLPDSKIDGKAYHYADGLSFSDIDIAEVPEWLLAPLPSPEPARIRTKTAKAGLKLNVPASIPDGTRHKVLSGIAGSALNYGIRNEKLEQLIIGVDQDRSLPPVGEEEARRIAKSMQNTHDANQQNDEWKAKNRESILEVARYAIAASDEWQGIRGKTELAALLGALSIAYERHTLITPAAYRPIAEHGQIGLKATHPAVKSLARKGWLTLHTSYHEYRRALEAQNAPVEEVAKVSNIYRFSIPEKCRTKTTVFPTSAAAHSLLSLCGTEVFRNRGLGKSGLQIIAILLGGYTKSRRQLAFAAGVSSDTAERKVAKMIAVGMVRETERGIELVDLDSLDMELIAKRLGTFGRGAKDKERHAVQREQYHKRLGLIEKNTLQIEESSVYRLEPERDDAPEPAAVGIPRDEFFDGLRETQVFLDDESQIQDDAVQDIKPVIPVGVSVNDIIVETALDVLGGQIVSL